MWKKLIVSIFCLVVLVPYAALAQEVMVSFDGSSADIAGQPTTNTPGPWDADDSVWSTTDEVVPAIGSQAAFKAAIAQAGTAQRGIAQAHTNGHVFVGGGSKNAEGAAGHAPSPWASIIGFDTTSFDDSLALSEISVTLRNRFATDTLDVRWFVEAGGETYVSGVVAADVGTTDTTVTLADAMVIEWFAFDKTANIEIGAALGSSVGMLALTDVDYVGIHQQLTYTTLQNWHGAYVPQFSATAIPYASTVARKPNPVDGSTEVLRNAVLGWTPGEFAATHDVYFGRAFSDVNDATPTTDPASVYKGRQAETSYDPGPVDFDQAYYWRVDEVSPDSTIFKGDVWSFTVEPEGVPLTSDLITATASSVDSDQIDPNATINRAGLDEKNLHDDEKNAMWLCSADDPEPWIRYDFDKAYKLHEMKVWNHNSDDELTLGYGIQQAKIETSADGETWTELDSLQTFNQASGAMDYAANTTISLGGVIAQSVRITALSNWSPWPDIITQKGLSEVQFSYIPVWAIKPYPDSGATNVDVDVTLGWKAGREADRHDVYLDTDEQAVIDGTVPVDTLTEAGYTTSLDLASIYYWRIGEVNDAETPPVWQGDVWNLSTQEYLVVEDFESYDVGNNEIWWAWKDGLGYVAHDNEPAYPGNGTGSAVGNETSNSYTEETIVHGGKQSMPLFYDNSSLSNSEATVNTDDLAIGRDWTAHGIQTLSLWFYGDAANVPGQLYVKINGVKVNYDGDSANLTLALWQRWNIDLASVVTNLQSVTSLTVGVEGAGAAGTLLLDSIRLYPTVRMGSDLGSEGIMLNNGGTLASQWFRSDDPTAPKSSNMMFIGGLPSGADLRGIVAFSLVAFKQGDVISDVTVSLFHSNNDYNNHTDGSIDSSRLELSLITNAAYANNRASWDNADQDTPVAWNTAGGDFGDSLATVTGLDLTTINTNDEVAFSSTALTAAVQAAVDAGDNRIAFVLRSPDLEETTTRNFFVFQGASASNSGSSIGPNLHVDLE